MQMFQGYLVSFYLYLIIVIASSEDATDGWPQQALTNESDDSFYSVPVNVKETEIFSVLSNCSTEPCANTSDLESSRGSLSESQRKMQMHRPELWSQRGCSFVFQNSDVTDCEDLPHECLNCSYNSSCIYGQQTHELCSAFEGYPCLGARSFNRTFVCQYCYQTDATEHSCSGISDCRSAAAPRQSFRSNCTVHQNVTCLGYRQFPKNLPCNWTSGYRWSFALLLSIVGGGFGADRFYLGYWQEGIGKLFSFGGLGVWTLVDVILIGVKFLGPADGSLYID